jgi:hypothetical protein
VWSEDSYDIGVLAAAIIGLVAVCNGLSVLAND